MAPRPNAYPQRLVRAAGAVVWRFVDAQSVVPAGHPIDPQQIEVLLVHRPRYHDWSWPKGKAEMNEPLVQAAVREVEEESGEEVVLHAPLLTQRYRLGSGHIKEVNYWVGTVLPKRTPSWFVRPPVAAASVNEIDTVKWCRPAKAKHLLTRRGDRRLLTELLGRAADGQLHTSATILLRHAKALSDEHWDGSATDRPLTRLGAAQALDVVPQLSAFGVEKIVTSPAKRAIQTVSPYAALTSIDPVVTDQLAVDADEETVGRLLTKELLTTHPPTVLCVHAQIWPAVQEILGRDVVKNAPGGCASLEQNLHTTEMLVVHSAAPKQQQLSVVACERHNTFTKVALD